MIVHLFSYYNPFKGPKPVVFKVYTIVHEIILVCLKLMVCTKFVLVCMKKYLKLTLDILELEMEKKQILGVFISNFETYIRYKPVSDKKQNKKDLRCYCK